MSATTSGRPHVTLLDGGMGHLLKERGITIPGLMYDQQFLATNLLNDTSPDTVTAVHKEYIEAGCDVITSNNFVATQYSLAKIGKADMVSHLVQAAARAAAAAKGSSGVLVAGCMPPLQESYRADGLPDDEDMVQQYSTIAAALAPHVDLLLCETLSTIKEVRCAATAAAAQGKPIWVSLSLEDSLRGCLRSGESLEEALAALACAAQLQAVLLNCCAPAAVSHAMPLLRQAAPEGVAVGAYANGFKTTTTQWLVGKDAPKLPVDDDEYDSAGIITPVAYLRHAEGWVRSGASIVGGCCGVGPAHISLLAQHLAGKPAS